VSALVIAQILGVVILGSLFHYWLAHSSDRVQRIVVAYGTVVLLLLVSAMANATPIVSDPCSNKPAVVQRVSPRQTPKSSPIIAWITVRSSGPSNPDAPRCTDPVLDIPEPELIGFDIEVPFPELFLDEHPVIWDQPTFGKYYWNVILVAPDKHERPRLPPPVSVPEPSSFWLFGAGLILMGWLGWERARRNRYLGEERRRRAAIFGRPAGEARAPEDVQ